MSAPDAPLSTAGPDSITSCEACRPLSGSPTICSCVIVVPTPVLRVSTIDAFGGHRDGFLNGADLHRHVDDRARPDGERETGSLVGVEALQLGFELVRADRQIRQHVLAALVGHDEPGDARGRLGHLDLDAGKRAAGFIAAPLR